MKSQNNILFISVALAGVYYLTQIKKSQGTTVTNNVTDANKRKAIIIWWETYEPAGYQVNNPGFEDVVNNISPSEIDIIYQYIFSYVAKGNYPAEGSILANQIAVIKKEYNIFQ
jgi:hypothetical protein